MVNELALSLDGWIVQVNQLDNHVTKMEGLALGLNKTIVEIDHRIVSEVDTLIEWVNHRANEMRELDDVTKDLLVRFSAMEDHCQG